MVLYRWINKRKLEAAREEGYQKGLIIGLRKAIRDLKEDLAEERSWRKEEQRWRKWMQGSIELLLEDNQRLRDWYANLPSEIRDQAPPPPEGKRQP